MRELKITFIQFAFITGGVDADDARGWRGREEGQEVLDEPGADIVAEGYSVFETIGIILVVN